MKRHGVPIFVVIIAAGCSPKYESGKTECSTGKLCPSGFSCRDDGTSGTHYCHENKSLGCSSDSGFYCVQSKTCWPKPGVCASYTECGTPQKPDGRICVSPNYHVDCSSSVCLPNGPLPDAGSGAGGVKGTGGATGRGGSGGSIVVGYGGISGTGGIPDSGMGGSGGNRDAARDGTGGLYGSGGLMGSGGYYLSGGVTGRGGTSGSGGSTVISLYCSGTPYPCSYQDYEGDCLTENGCIWNPSTYTCTGTASACSTYSTSTWCLYNGCDWAGPMTCRSTPTTSYCLDMLTPSSPDCEICVYSSCCGQTTDCMNDYDCYYNSKGPVWNAWVDCGINCCGVTCEWY